MSNLLTLRTAEAAHWYDKDGVPHHFRENGKRTTLSDARKNNWYPSVTSIIHDTKRNVTLEDWRARGLVEQALTMPREPNESDEVWWDRVKAADAEERAKAPDLGSDVHLQLSDYISGREKYPRVPGVDLVPVIAWINEHVEGGVTEKSFCYQHLGYAGCIDFTGEVDGKLSIIDFKTQAVKNGKPTIYSEWGWQLVAYAAGQMEVDLYSVVIDTTEAGVFTDKNVKLWTPEEKEWAWKGFLGLRDAWYADRKYRPA
jgi:hypothetical protein